MSDKVFIIGGSQNGREEKKQKYALVQWYEDGKTPGEFNRVNCSDMYNVPEGALKQGISKFRFDKKKRLPATDQDLIGLDKEHGKNIEKIALLLQSGPGFRYKGLDI